MTKYGYGRVSTTLQNLSQQQAALEQFGVEPEFFLSDTYTGTTRDRKNLKQLLSELEEGDELHVVKLDRLGRSARDLHDIARELEQKGVVLVIGGVKHDPKTPIGKMLFGVLALFAEFERDLIAERTAVRLEQLKAEGKTLGRKRRTTAAQDRIVARMLSDGYSYSEIQTHTGLGRGTISRISREAKDRDELSEDPTLMKAARYRQSERAKKLDKLAKQYEQAGEMK